MKRIALFTIAAIALTAGSARADSGALFGESARAVSLADSVVARPGDTSAIYFNPAGIADLSRPTLVLLGHVGDRQLSFARYGEVGTLRHTLSSGYGVSLVARLPGPEWLSRVHIGGAVHLPGGDIIRVVAPVRDDTPLEPYYGDRLDRTAVTAALGIDLPYGLRVGAAVTVTANLVAPTLVGFDASRGMDVDSGITVAQDRHLTMDASFIVGARWQAIPELAFGAVWRQGGATRASGAFTIDAGSIVVDDAYNFYDLLAPEEVAIGACVTPISQVSLSLDLTWARWSDYRTIHDELPDPRFSDVLDVRVGAEWIAHESLRVRVGYAFLPSPVPAQVGVTNFLDADRHEITFGAGVDFEPIARVPVRLDLGLRFHAQGTQRATKDAARLVDAQPDAAGRTLDNLGYPGFTSRGSFASVSLSVTIALDGTAAPPASDANGEGEDDEDAATGDEASARDDGATGGDAVTVTTTPIDDASATDLAPPTSPFDDASSEPSDDDAVPAAPPADAQPDGDAR